MTRFCAVRVSDFLALSSPLLAFASLPRLSPLANSSCRPRHLAIEKVLEVVNPKEAALKRVLGQGQVASLPRAEEVLGEVCP
jgi:hypothetical protein